MDCAVFVLHVSLVLLLWKEPNCDALSLTHKRRTALGLPLGQAKGRETRSWLWDGSGNGLGSDLESGSGLTLEQVKVNRKKWVRVRTKRSWVWNQFFVVEEFIGDEPLYIGKLHSDLDRGDGSVLYSLSGPGSSMFSVDRRSGDIHALRRLDRETQPLYRLSAAARDTHTLRLLEPETNFVIKVQDINDNEPRFVDGPYTARIPERSPKGTSVITVKATDADDPTYGHSARVTYSLIEGADWFTVEPHTGVIRVSGPLDREVRHSHVLLVQAADMAGLNGALTGTTAVSVTLTDVNDNKPSFTRKSYKFSVPESLQVNSTVGRVKAVDPDVGVNAEMDFRLLEGDGTFEIHTDTRTQEGVITLHKALDFETKSSFSLRVEVCDRYPDPRFLSGSAFGDSALLRVMIEDSDEPPVFSNPYPMNMAVSEAAQTGSEVGRVSAQDPDRIKSPVRYSISLQSDIERLFNIDSSSGLITTNKHLDRETAHTHNLTVIATEILNSSQVSVCVVCVSVLDINDNAPTFSSNSTLTVCENSEAGQVIETLSAVDPDLPEHGHHFLFSLRDDSNFTLRGDTDNSVSVLTRHSLHSSDQLLLVVTVTDGVLSSSATFSVSVCVCEANANANPRGHSSACREETPSLTSTLTLAAVSILSLLGAFIVTVVVRNRRWMEPQISDEERNVSENIVYYNDEGEEADTTFDLFTLRHTHFNIHTDVNTHVKPETNTEKNLKVNSNPPMKTDANIFTNSETTRIMPLKPVRIVDISSLKNTEINLKTDRKPTAKHLTNTDKNQPLISDTNLHFNKNFDRLTLKNTVKNTRKNSRTNPGTNQNMPHIKQCRIIDLSTLGNTKNTEITPKTSTATNKNLLKNPAYEPRQ